MRVSFRGLLFFQAVLIVWVANPGISPPKVMAQTNVAAQHLPLPAVPYQTPRPSEGEAENEQWRSTPRAPVASMFESPLATDVAIEVVVGQGRLLTTKQPLAEDGETAFIAVGDPNIIDFEILPNPRMIRITGLHPGVTDLSFTTSDGETYSFEVRVVYDLRLLNAYLQQQFPDALIELGQIRDHVIVKGQARHDAQVGQILSLVEAYITSVQAPGSGGGSGATSTLFASRVINLLRVPGVHQVMLQVKIAELDRTAMREIGADIFINAAPGVTIGTQLGNAAASLLGLDVSTGTTAFGIFSAGDFQIFFDALRNNGLLTLLAEPNLVTLSGHEASFFAGGEFPISVPQGSGGGITTTVEFKDFGTQLSFIPYVLDDGTIRLEVASEVSTIDFALGVTLVPGGDPVPGVNSRRVTTTVELKQGYTLAIAGLLQVSTDAETDRIPGLGDLPYIGALFSNTSHQHNEKELLIMVTPYLVSPMRHDQVGPLPGTEVLEPTDHEFYFRNQIEGRTGIPFRSTTSWDRTQQRFDKAVRMSIYGPIGFSE